MVFSQLYNFKNYNHKDGLLVPNIYDIKQTDDGYIWLGTKGMGLMRYNGDQFVEIDNTDSLGAFYQANII